MKAAVKKVNVQIKIPKCFCHTADEICFNCPFMNLSDRNGRDCWCSFHSKYYDPEGPTCWSRYKEQNTGTDTEL